MRRLASVFSSKRSRTSQADDDANSATGIHPRRTPKRGPSVQEPASVSHSHHSRGRVLSGVPPSLTTSVSSNPSDASSGASSSPQTPADEDIPPQEFSRKKVFSWFAGRKTARSQAWQPSSTAPPVLKNPSAIHPVSVKPPHDSDTSESEEEAEDDDEDDDALFATLDPETISRAKTRLRAIATNQLSTRPHSSPFYHAPTAPSFPRSCNHSATLQPTQTLRTTMLHTRLLKRLENSVSLAGQEPRSLASFSMRPTPLPIKLTASPDVDDSMPELRRVTSHSPGLGRWMGRACFEALHVDWACGRNGDINYRAISCTRAVADIEFSVFLEAASVPAGSEHEPKVPPVAQNANAGPSTDAPAQRAQHVPSPLRIGHAPPSVASTSSKQSISAKPDDSTPMESIAPEQAIKRGVRFVEDDKEDRIPLGYVLRMKQKKAEKAKFLKEEAEKRQFDLEKARVDAERRQREQERRQWEAERQAWEQEKRAAEEEKKARAYAEEVVKARQRRESSRAGFGSQRLSNGSDSGLTSLAPRTIQRLGGNDAQPRTYGSVRSSRRTGSEASIPAIATTNIPTSGDNGTPSPASSSSRPSSIVGYAQSRPPSLHSTPMTSVEDVRASSNAAGKRRHSDHQGPSLESLGALPYAQTWSASHQNLSAVPIAMPFYMNGMMDPNMMVMMPLLPPTPPFMAQQYARSKSRHSSSSPSRQGQSSNRNSSSSSVDKHYSSNSMPTRRGTSNASTSSLVRPQGSVSSSPHRTHQRQKSNEDAINYSNERGRRGRAAHQNPSQTQLPSPWTALPSNSYFPTTSSHRQSAYLS